MAQWELKVWDHAGAVVDTYTPGQGVLITYPECEVDPYGNCLSMRFRGRPDLLDIGPRYIVQYSEYTSGTKFELFFGVIVFNPHPESKGAGPEDGNTDDLELYEAVGAMKLLNDTTVGYDVYEDAADLNVIILNYLSDYNHPALASLLTTNLGDLAGIQITSPVYYGGQPLDEALEDLVGEYGQFALGVDPRGIFFVSDRN